MAGKKKTPYVPLTYENAAFVAVKKVAVADVVATEHHFQQPEGAVLEEIGIYCVVQPEGPSLSENAVGFREHKKKLDELDGVMRRRAGINTADVCGYAEKIVPEAVDSIFSGLESTNTIALQRGFMDAEKNHTVVVVTERLD